ncbi:MAG: DUF4340 domain-containing protein, partial [Proteobacteria bacterium]|nr:DUF4340 domain-containing protein [Pseudomonadota bacterium]
VVVTVQDAAGKDLVGLIVGKQRYAKGASAAGDGTYVRKVGDAQAWLVRSRLSIDRDATRWLERRVVDVARERVELVRNVQGDGVRLVVAKARPADQDFSIADIPEGRKAKSSYDANSVGTAFDSLELDDVRPAADLAFPTEGAMAEMESFDGFVLRAVWAEKDGQNWVRLVARYQEPAKMPEASDSASAKLKSADDVRKEVAVFNGRHGAWAYRIPDYRLDYMKKKMNDLLEEKKEAS